MANRFYTTGEAATELGVTPGRVRQMVVDGELLAQKFGRDLMISAEAIEAAKNRKKMPGPVPAEKGKAVPRKSAKPKRAKKR